MMLTAECENCGAKVCWLCWQEDIERKLSELVVEPDGGLGELLGKELFGVELLNGSPQRQAIRRAICQAVNYHQGQLRVQRDALSLLQGIVEDYGEIISGEYCQQAVDLIARARKGR